MTNCCDDYGNCRQGRDCPVRVERMRQVRDDMSRDKPNIPLLLIERLVLVAIVLLVILVGATYQDALRALA